MADESTYGFSKADAGELINLIGSGATEFSEEWPGGGSGGGSRLVQFVMTSDWSGTAADADFSEMTGAFIESALLRDPNAIFAVLESGAAGLAMFQGGEYYAIQAKCPPPEDDEE